MPKSKVRPCILNNDDTVVAHTKTGVLDRYKFGELKQLFIAKKIKHVITKLYSPRLNKYFVAKYHPTAGFTLEPYQPPAKVD